MDQTRPIPERDSGYHDNIKDFNSSIEIKLLPFFSNPASVPDWVVPVALIDLHKRTERLETHWDLTIIKVIPWIDGVNHVSKIAHLADCDLELARLAIAHLLYCSLVTTFLTESDVAFSYYQVIMTTDMFQYSNMYTMQKNIQWLADEPHVFSLRQLRKLLS